MENEALVEKMWPSKFQKYHKIELIAVLNLIIITYGVYLTVEDIFAQYYPSSLHEVAVLFFYYSFQYALIGLLLIGHKYQKPLLYLPWMTVIHILLIFVTYLWIKNIFEYGMFYETSSFFINLIVLGIGWLGWSLVSLDFLSRYLNFQKNPEIISNNKNVKDT